MAPITINHPLNRQTLRPPGLLLRPPAAVALGHVHHATPHRPPVATPALMALGQPQVHRRHRQRRPPAAALPDTAAAPAATSSSSSSVLGAAVLVAGTAVGAGILALPAATQQAGFAPSAVALTGGAVYSVATGLLIAEVALRATRRRNRAGRQGGGAPTPADAAAVSLQSMASASLGPTGASVASAAYLFLHYALLVAYVAKAGELLAAPVDPSAAPCAGAAFAALLGAICFFAPPAQLDAANGAMFAGTVAAFAALCVLAAAGDGGETSVFAHLLDAAANPAAWAALPPALPLIALAFVFHNVVPVVSASLGGDAKRIRAAISLGVALPWLMLLAWEAATLGGGGGTVAADATTTDPLARLAASSENAAPLIAAFSLGAVATSFLGFTLGLTTFFDDALPVLRRLEEGGGADGGKNNGSKGDDDGAKSNTNSARPPASAFALTLLPPVAFAAVNPGAFFSALDAAGTYGVLTLFGLLPPAMVWAERYGGAGEGEEEEEEEATPELLPGGKAALLAVGGLAAVVMANSAAADVAAALAASTKG